MMLKAQAKLRQDFVELKMALHRKEITCRVRRQLIMMKIFVNYINDKELKARRCV